MSGRSEPFWRKSSYSVEGNCVEVADLGDAGVLVRDSKNPQTTLHFDRQGWVAFVHVIKTGQLSRR